MVRTSKLTFHHTLNSFPQVSIRFLVALKYDEEGGEYDTAEPDAPEA